MKTIGNLLQKKTSTPDKNDDDTKGKLPIDFEEDRMKGAAAVPLPLHLKDQGKLPHSSHCRQPLT